ncbi:unnamed protein product [Bathycoccus prasinos]
MQQKQGGKTNTATTTTTSSSFNTNTNNVVRPRANAHLFKKARMIEEEDDLEDDLDDEFKLESDEEDEVMGSGEEDVEEHSEELEEEEVGREEEKEEKVNEEAKEANEQEQQQQQKEQREATNSARNAELIQPRNLQIALTKVVARGEEDFTNPASTNAIKRKVLPPTPGNTPVEMAVEGAEKVNAMTKEQSKTSSSNLLLKQRSMLPPTMTSPSKKKRRGEGGKENAAKPRSAEDLPIPTNTATAVATKGMKESTNTPKLSPQVPPVETNANRDCLEDEKRYAAEAIDLTSRLEKLLDEAKELTNRSTNTALQLTVASCEFHFAVNPAKIKQIKEYTKQAEEILAREELRKPRVSATAAKK